MPRPNPNCKEQVPLGILRLLTVKPMTREEMRVGLNKDSCSSIDHALKKLLAAGLVEKSPPEWRPKNGKTPFQYCISYVLRHSPFLASNKEFIPLPTADAARLASAARKRLEA